MKEGLFGQIEMGQPVCKSLQRRDHLTFRGNASLGRHGWLRLTPAYSLHLVRELLKETRSDEMVLDPFSGTGTTPLACASMGIRSDAVDINPFLVWFGNLKMMPLGDYVARQVQVASTRIAEEIDVSHSTIWQPNLHAIEKWWDTPTLHALAALYCAISQHPHERGEHVIDLLRVAFCRVMIQMANVSFGHQSMSFKKNGVVATDSLLREGSGDCVRRIAGAFVVSAREVANSITVEPPIAEARVFLGDSRDLSSVLCGRQYTTVITSPPYPNRMSYIRELRPYMYWLGFLSDGRQAGELDWKAIGGTWGCATSLLNTWTPNGYSEIPFSNFDQIVREISKGHALLGRYVHKYFEDIKSHLLNLRKVLAPGARCHYIVGNSKFYDTLLPVEEIYAELFKDTGFVNVGIETIRKRSSKKELFEFVVNAQMPG